MAGGTAGWTRQGAIGGQAACMHLPAQGAGLEDHKDPTTVRLGGP